LIEGKGLGGKKVNRVNLSLANEYDNKLKKLATACNMDHTPLARLILEKCLDDAQFVNELQKEYCTQKAYKIRLVLDKGVITYVLTGREDI
jgi:hypothetical protein